MMDRHAASSRMDHEAEGAQAQWLGAMQSLAEQIEKQQQYSQQMTQELMNTYMQLLNTPGSYLSGQAEQQQQTIQQTARQWMEPGPTTAAGLPAAGPTAAVLPADDPGGHEHLLRAFQHPSLLRPGRLKGRPVPHRGLRRADRGGGQRAPRRALGRRPT
jgi:hypothetical protein